MQEKSNGKGIIIAILSILLVMSILYIGYEKILKKDNTANSTPIQTTNLYSIYSDNLKNKILNNTTDFFEVGNGYMYGKEVYKVFLNKKLELIVRIDEKQFNCKLQGDYKVAENVISFTIAQSGPGGESNVYFIKDDGTVGCAKVGKVFSSGIEKIEVIDNFLNLKDIISIVQTSYDNNGLTQEPLFIDINGNVIKDTDSAWD